MDKKGAGRIAPCQSGERLAGRAFPDQSENIVVVLIGRASKVGPDRCGQAGIIDLERNILAAFLIGVFPSCATFSAVCVDAIVWLLVAVFEAVLNDFQRGFRRNGSEVSGVFVFFRVEFYCSDGSHFRNPFDFKLLMPRLWPVRGWAECVAPECNGGSRQAVILNERVNAIAERK